VLNEVKSGVVTESNLTWEAHNICNMTGSYISLTVQNN